MTETRPVDSIKVGDRARKDMGDLDGLAASIEENGGLIQPIVIRSDGTLIAGCRRLAAYKKLGRGQIEVNIRNDLDGAVEKLVAERDENTCREDFKPSEMARLGMELEKLTPSRQGERTDRELVGDSPTSSPPPTRGKRPKVAAALGVGEQQYEQAKKVVTAAESGDPVAREAVAEMDRTGKVSTAHRKVFGSPAPGVDTKTDAAGREQPKTFYGKGDKWKESTEPLHRYLSAWRKRDYDFSHLNPREASSRLKRIENLIEGLEAVRADLEPRSHKAKLTL